MEKRESERASERASETEEGGSERERRRAITRRGPPPAQRETDCRHSVPRVRRPCAAPGKPPPIDGGGDLPYLPLPTGVLERLVIGIYRGIPLSRRCDEEETDWQDVTEHRSRLPRHSRSLSLRPSLSILPLSFALSHSFIYVRTLVSIVTHHSIRRTTVHLVSAHIPGGEIVQAGRNRVERRDPRQERTRQRSTWADVAPTTSRRPITRTYEQRKVCESTSPAGTENGVAPWYATAAARSHARTARTFTHLLVEKLRWFPRYAAPPGPRLDCIERRRTSRRSIHHGGKFESWLIDW